MAVASTGYPVLDAFWTIIVFFAWIVFIWLLILVYTDLFRRTDIGGWGKTGWVILTLVLPFIGVFIYLIAEGHKMDARSREASQQAQAQMDTYVRSVAGSGSTADQIAQAKQLLDAGAITPAEYDALKQKALAA